MRKLLVLFLLAVAACGVFLGLTLLRNRPASRLLAELPAPILAAVPHGDDVLAAAGDAGLFRIDGETGQVTKLFQVADQQVADLLVQGDVVLVLAYGDRGRRSVLHTIDPQTGSVIRSAAMGGVVADLAGFLPNGYLVVVEGGQVRFIETYDGSTRGRVLVTGGILGGAHLVGERLYVSRSYGGGLAVIDTARSEVVDLIETEDWLVDVDVIGAGAYVTGGQHGLVRLDLGTHRIEPCDYLDMHAPTVDELFALDRHSLRKLDAKEATVRAASLPESLTDELAGKKPFLVSVTEADCVIAVREKLFKVTSLWPHGGVQQAIATGLTGP